MVGWSGIGKSHLMQAIGQRACVHGYHVLYQTSAQLLADLTASLGRQDAAGTAAALCEARIF